MDIAASILSCDWARLGAIVETLEAAGCDRLHLDVMDGHFVPAISFGADMVAALRPHFSKHIEVHLMVQEAHLFLSSFAQAGADSIIVHLEAGHMDGILTTTRQLGKQVGVALNPATSASGLESLLERLDMILVMSVNPGYGGQSFMASQLAKVRQIKTMTDNYQIRLAVDGGVNQKNIAQIATAGADQVIVGSWLLGNPDDIATPLATLRQSLAE